MKSAAANGSAPSIENELLVCSVRPSVSTEISERIKSLLRQSLDWNYLIEVANEHRIIPVFYDRLQGYQDFVPAAPLAELKERYHRISNSNLGLTGKLLKLLALLREHDIAAIPYKGPALAQGAYGDIRLRQFTDLDILVRKRDVYKVKDVLIANDCQPGWALTKKQEAAVLRHYYEYPFLCNDRRVLVEIHWALAEQFFSFAFDVEQLWERGETLFIQGKPLLTLSVEDALLVACAHGSKHVWKRLGWICDVAKLVSRRTDLDWELVIERATALGLLRIVWLGLRLASDLLGTELPEAVSRQVCSDPAVKTIAERLEKRLFSADTVPGGTFAMTRLQLKMRERVTDRFNYCFRLVFMTKLVDSLFMPMGRPR